MFKRWKEEGNMLEYPFNMKNVNFGTANNNIVLLQDGEKLYLSLRDNEKQEITRIEVLHISKVKKLTNFFMRGFNIRVTGKNS